MKSKIFLLVVILMSVFCIISITSAQVMTDAQRQAMIDQIKQQIIVLEAKITQIIQQQENCKQNWQCGSWGICFNSQQSRICTDQSACGSTTNEPATSQTCKDIPAVSLQVNNSSGPLNLFLTLGNGAIVNNAGINLTENLNLQWQGVDVSSCSASDTANPTIFSGYEPVSGSQNVYLSGSLPQSATNNAKISDTFKINCIATQTGASVSDNVTVNLFYAVNGVCTPNWQCTPWTTCTGSQTRICIDYNGCGSLVGKPALTQSCVACVPNWQCGAWGLCLNNQETRTCSDFNSCGVTKGQPNLTQSCVSPKPSVDIKANNSNGPLTIANNGSVTLTWTSANTTSCAASGGWSGQEGASGSTVISNIATSTTYTLTCTGSYGTVSDSVIVNPSGS